MLKKKKKKKRENNTFEDIVIVINTGNFNGTSCENGEKTLLVFFFFEISKTALFRE